MAAAASVLEYALQIARAGAAAALGVALGTAPNAANATGLYADLTAAAEQVKIVAGAVDGAAFGVSSGDIRLTLQAGTRDGIRLAPRGGGSGSFVATFTTAALTASRTATLLDADQTLAGSASALTATQLVYGVTGGLLSSSSTLTLTGGSLGILTLGANATSAATLNINGSVSYRTLRFQTAGSIRWDVATGSTAETGSDAGSQFNIAAYNDAGSVIDIPISIARAAAGLITIVRPITTSSNITLTAGAFNQSGSPGVFSTGTGTNTLNGPITVASTANSTVGAINLAHGTSSQAILNLGTTWTTSKFDSQGTAWSSRTIGAGVVFNQASTDRPEISWYRGARSYPEFSIREHTTADTGGEIWAGGGTVQPTKVLEFSSTALTTAVNITQTGSTTLSTGTGSISLNGDTTIAAGKRLGVGGLSAAALFNIHPSATGTSGVNQYSFLTSATSASDATTSTIGFVSAPTTSAAAYTTTILAGFSAWRGGITLGSTSAATRTAGFMVQATTVGGTANHGFYHSASGSSALTGSGNWSLYLDAALPNYLGTGATYIGTTAAINTDEIFQAIKSTATTNAVTPGLVLGANSTGTAAAGFGHRVRFTLASSTTSNTTAFDDEVSWVVATHASRTARRVFSVYDTAAREAMRMEASGSAPMVGFLGAAASARITFAAWTGTATRTTFATSTATLANCAEAIKAIIDDLRTFGLYG